MLDIILLTYFYTAMFLIIFLGIIAVGCLINEEFKQDFINDWNRT